MPLWLTWYFSYPLSKIHIYDFVKIIWSILACLVFSVTLHPVCNFTVWLIVFLTNYDIGEAVNWCCLKLPDIWWKSPVSGCWLHCPLNVPFKPSVRINLIDPYIMHSWSYIVVSLLCFTPNLFFEFGAHPYDFDILYHSLNFVGVIDFVFCNSIIAL